mgnify:CR=1 FL=1
MFTYPFSFFRRLILPNKLYQNENNRYAMFGEYYIKSKETHLLSELRFIVMFLKSSVIVLALCALGIKSQLFFDQKCQKVQPVKHFNLSRVRILILIGIMVDCNF